MNPGMSFSLKHMSQPKNNDGFSIVLRIPMCTAAKDAPGCHTCLAAAHPPNVPRRR